MEPRKLQKKLEKIIKKIRSERRWCYIVEELESIRKQVEFEANQADAHALDDRTPYYGG